MMQSRRHSGKGAGAKIGKRFARSPAGQEQRRKPRVTQVQAAQGRSPVWLRLAEEVIRVSDRTHPADRSLREVLKRARSVPDNTKRIVAETVQSYYRWMGWLEDPVKLREAIERTRELAKRYASRPRSFADAEFRKRVVPHWVWKCLATDLDWCRFLQRPPVLWLRAKKGEGAALRRTLGNCRPGPEGMPEAVRYEGREDLFRTEAFREGRFEVQDLSSQMVGILCDPQPGEHWWDVCAGEGGKAMHLAERMQGRGVVWTTDRASWRLERLRRRAARGGVFNYRASVWKGIGRLPIPFPVDGVLVDAPCSGLGTWQRYPQARWTTRLSDVEELADVQLNLLRAAAQRVKPGGRLIYSVCTLSRRETLGVTSEFEELESEFEPVELVDLSLPTQRTKRLWLRSWNDGGNGMFVASWRRCASSRPTR
jgi:16S rRNA (cytosine967-C5)-methyltransferase